MIPVTKKEYVANAGAIILKTDSFPVAVFLRQPKEPTIDPLSTLQDW
jgi:hypothetical protein